MLNLQKLEEATNYKDLNEEDTAIVRESKFSVFKAQFIFQNMKLIDAMELLMVVRQRIENDICQNFSLVVDASKKHTWVSQKLFDAYKINSSVRMRNLNSNITKIETEEEKGEAPYASN